jgi:DNA adenine methylase
MAGNGRCETNVFIDNIPNREYNNTRFTGGSSMDFMTAKEASEQWGISRRRVAILCSENRIDGAEMMDKMWLIPNTATKPDDARSLRFQPLECLPVKPFVKWAGGKAQILDEIRRLYPIGLGTTIMKYAEPFVGGGAVLFDILLLFRDSIKTIQTLR